MIQSNITGPYGMTILIQKTILEIVNIHISSVLLITNGMIIPKPYQILILPQIQYNLAYIFQTIPNITLPNNKQRTQVKYQNFTQQMLDDWIAQSMNRTIHSMLNPNKKYYIPTNLDQQLKIRYKKQRKNLKIQPDDTYFKTKSAQSKSYLNHKKNKTIDISDLIVDYHKLSPKTSLGNRFITKRQLKSVQPKKQIKRRNAVLLQKDIHYQRYLKQKKTIDPQSSLNQINAQKKIIQSLNKNKLFTLNYQSLKRNKPNDHAPSSITQYEGIQIQIPPPKFSLQKNNKKQLIKQEQQQQKYRLKGNAQAEQAYSIMQNYSARTHRSFRTKVSISEQKQRVKNENPKLLSTLSLFDPNLLTHKTQKKLNQQKSGVLGKKVIKLLSQMHVQSQNINIEMAKFKIHPQFIQLNNFDTNNITHKWIRKAQQELKLSHDQIAFECYKQAIICDPQLFNPVYNFATLLQRENRYICSLQWFNLARQFDCDNERVSYAISLINMKMQKFQQSFKQINNLIHYLLQQRKKVDVKYYYIRSICNKKFGKYELAKKDYKIVLQQSKLNNQNGIGNFIISYLFAKKRRYLPHVDCLAYTKINQLVYMTLYEKQTMLNDGDLNNLANKIKNSTFFKRFSPHLVQRLVKISTYEYHQKNQIIFIKPDQCIIILDGLLLIKNHRKNIMVHEITSVLKQGDFVGGNSIDNYCNNNLNNWYHSHTQVQLLRIKSQEFQSFWRGQITIQIDQKYNKFKNNKLFYGLSQSVLLKLCELMNVKKYKKDEMIFNDCSYKIKINSKVGCGFSLSNNYFLDIQLNKPSNNKSNNDIKDQGFNQLKFQGFYIVKSGKIAIQDEKGFYNQDVISEGDFIGQNLIIPCEGFQKYGRIRVASQQAELYLLQNREIMWLFSLDDKQIMENNIKNMSQRKSLELIKDLKKRYYQYLQLKQQINNQSDY